MQLDILLAYIINEYINFSACMLFQIIKPACKNESSLHKECGVLIPSSDRMLVKGRDNMNKKNLLLSVALSGTMLMSMVLPH